MISKYYLTFCELSSHLLDSMLLKHRNFNFDHIQFTHFLFCHLLLIDVSKKLCPRSNRFTSIFSSNTFFIRNYQTVFQCIITFPFNNLMEVLKKSLFKFSFKNKCHNWKIIYSTSQRTNIIIQKAT